MPGRGKLRCDQPETFVAAFCEAMEVLLSAWIPEAEPGAPFRVILDDGEVPERADLLTRERVKKKYKLPW